VGPLFGLAGVVFPLLLLCPLHYDCYPVGLITVMQFPDYSQTVTDPTVICVDWTYPITLGFTHTFVLTPHIVDPIDYHCTIVDWDTF